LEKFTRWILQKAKQQNLPGRKSKKHGGKNFAPTKGGVSKLNTPEKKKRGIISTLQELSETQNGALALTRGRQPWVTTKRSRPKPQKKSEQKRAKTEGKEKKGPNPHIGRRT